MSEWPKTIWVCPECGKRNDDPGTCHGLYFRKTVHPATQVERVEVLPASLARELADAIEVALGGVCDYGNLLEEALSHYRLVLPNQVSSRE